MIDFDYIEWDEDDDPGGNVQHIAANGLSPAEVESVLYDPAASPSMSRASGRPVVFGHTDTGKYIIVVYKIRDEGGFRILEPITAYEVPEPRGRAS